MTKEEIEKHDKEFPDRYGLEPQTVDSLKESRPKFERELKRALLLEEVYSLLGGELLSDEE